MLVQCPNCKTTYKVSDEVLKGAAPAFRCSRCRHTFELEADEPAPTAGDIAAAAPAKQPPPAEDQELSFSFPPKEVAEPAAVEPSEPEPPTPTSAPSAASSDKEIGADDQWSIHGQNELGEKNPQ
ncbi:MAG: hypothetical protein FJ143_03720, partial [Deltaproteobacteria bacterium]|nr:hypothetical protein [Deltaproteobacteria bacterium]